MNIKYKDGKLTIGYSSIIFLCENPVAYARCTGGVFYLSDVVTLTEIKTYYPDTLDKQFKPIGEEEFQKGIIPILLVELTMYNLHQSDVNTWYAA